MKKKVFRLSALAMVLILCLSLSFGCGKQEEKPVIGISWCEDITVDESEFSEDLVAYIDAVEKAGGEVVLLDLFEDADAAQEALEDIDGVILTGGEDLDPSYYNEEAIPELEDVNSPRDVSDFILLEEVLNKEIPLLAICRGCQILNVFEEGTLYQDLPSQLGTGQTHRTYDQIDFAYHKITIEEGSFLYDVMNTDVIYVNSWHHQGIKDLAPGYKAVAVAEDGVIESIEKDGDGFVVGLQFHPEWHVDDGDDDFLEIFKAFFRAAE